LLAIGQVLGPLVLLTVPAVNENKNDFTFPKVRISKKNHVQCVLDRFELIAFSEKRCLKTSERY